MKSRHRAPVEWNRDEGDFRFVQIEIAAPIYELRGLWFSPREAQAHFTL
jgi:hypothetical protein